MAPFTVSAKQGGLDRLDPEVLQALKGVYYVICFMIGSHFGSRVNIILKCTEKACFDVIAYYTFLFIP